MKAKVFTRPEVSILDMSCLSGPPNQNSFMAYRESREGVCLLIRTHGPTALVQRGPRSVERDMIATARFTRSEFEELSRFISEQFGLEFQEGPVTFQGEEPKSKAGARAGEINGEGAEAWLTNRYGQDLIDLRVYSLPLVHGGKPTKRMAKQEVTIKPALLPGVMSALRRAGQAYKEGKAGKGLGL